MELCAHVTLMTIGHYHLCFGAGSECTACYAMCNDKLLRAITDRSEYINHSEHLRMALEAARNY